MSFPKYAEYKESGVEWLGLIPSHWDVVQSRRLFKARRESAKEDDVMLTASQKYGMIPQSEFVEKEGRRVVEVIKGKENLIHVMPDDFVISMRSFQGGLEWCRYKGSTSFHYVPVPPIKNVVPSFFAHLLKSAAYISALRSTTNLIRDGQEIRYSNFVQAPLPIVPEKEQLAIASFLDHETAKIDALIAEQERLIEILQEKRQAVITHAVTKGLNPDAPMRDSGVEWLGEVPEHWEVGQTRRFCKQVKTGRTPNTEDFSTSQHSTPWFSPSCFTENLAHTQPEKEVSPNSILEGRSACFTEAAVLVIGIGATLGRVAFPGTKCSANQQINALEPAPEKIKSSFLAYALMASTNQMKLISNSSTIGIMNQEKTKSLLIACPPLAEQEKIILFIQEKTSEIDALKAKVFQSNRILNERRSALISAAVTGQIDVRHLSHQEVAA